MTTEQIIDAAGRVRDRDQIVRMVQIAVDAERERCAKVADRVAAQAQEQIERNDEYMARTGSRDHEPNNRCRLKKHTAESIALDIRANA
jgi:hypothetical protein